MHWSPGDPRDSIDYEGIAAKVLGGPPERSAEEYLLESRRLGVRGVADYVAFRGGEAAVVESKRGRWGRERAALQASLYALILEDHGYRAHPVVAWAGGWEELPRRTLADALAAIAGARRVISRPVPPRPRGRPPCHACNYRLVCPYSPPADARARI